MAETLEEDANPPWNARERTLTKNMEGYLQISEKLQVGISELEYFLIGLVGVVSLAENARDGGGFSRFVVLDTRRRNEVAFLRGGTEGETAT